MITSDLVCQSAYNNGNNSFNKRLKALEQAIASMSTTVASDTVKGNNGEFVNAKVTDTATINKENVEQSTIQDLNAAHIDNRGGFAALGTVTVESLTVGSEVKADYENLHATNLNADNAEITSLNADSASLKNLEVLNKMSKLDVAQLYIDTLLAISQSGLTLKIAEAFHKANFKCSLRPTWQDKPLALQEDTTTVFTLIGIVDDDSLLPATATNGETYFVRNHVDGLESGPAIAAYVNDEWQFIFYPGLDDYVSKNDFAEWTTDEYEAFKTTVENFESVLVPVEDATDFDENPANYRIKTIYDNVTSLLHQLNETAIEGEDPTWYDWKASVNEFIETTYPATIEEINAELANKVENPTENGQYLREVNDGVASWTKLADNDSFVNKSYEDDDKASTITNDENGVNIETNIGFTATTPESTETTNKSVINQEYLRTNLNLSKESSANNNSSLYYEAKSVLPEDQFLCLTSTYGNENAYHAMKRNPIDYVVATKNYRYYRFTNYVSNEANTYTFFFAIDKSGNISKLNIPADNYLNSEAQASVHGGWAAFNPSCYDGECDDVVYYSFPRAIVNGVAKGYINMYKDGKFYGRVKDANDEEYGVWTASNNVAPQYYRWGGKSLRGTDKRILMVNDSSTAADTLQAFLIGIDANGEEALDRGKTVALPSKITWGREGIAVGKNYFWFQNGTSNIFSRVDKDGNIASYTLVDPVEQVALSSTGLRNVSNNYIELENGDVIFYVANLNSTLGYDYFVYCSDDTTSVSPVTVFRSSVKFSHAESNTERWPLAGQFPFVECGNYVYFFPTFSYNATDAGNVMGSGNSTWWKSVANQYARLDKQSMSWSYTQVPWSIGNFASYGPAQHLITEDGYLWVFPNQVHDAALDGSQCLCISPTGQTTTVDLGTGTAVNFFYTGGTNDRMNGWTCYLNQGGDASWSYARMQNCLAAVNSHGLGCLISPDMRHILLFKGNGEFKHYDYSNYERGFFPIGTINYRGGPSLIPAKDGFILGYSTNTPYRLTTAPEAENCGIIYISAKDDLNAEPTFKAFETIEGNGLFLKYREGYEYNMTYEDYRKRFLTMSETRMHECPVQQAVGIGIWKESNSASGGTIYLKDGDYEISEVKV